MKQLTFDRKMIRFITRALVLSTSVIILVSAGSTIMSVTNKSTQMAMKEVDVMTVSTEDNFKQYHGLIWAIILDQQVQGYLNAQENQHEYIGGVNSVLDNVCNMWGNINFITILREDGTGVITKGKSIPNWIRDFNGVIKQDYEESIVMRSNAMQMSFTDKFNRMGEYTLSIYFPLYSNSVISQKLGTLCINLEDANLRQLKSSGDSNKEFIVDSYLVHKDGEIIACTDTNEMNTIFQETTFDENETIKTTLGNVMIYKKLENWDFYYVTRISWWELLKDSVWTVGILIVMLGVFIIIMIQLAKKLVIKAYEPWSNVVTAMGDVSMGDLNTRLQVLDHDPDMKVVAKGFNSMMEQLMKLMKQVKEEQYQIDQIRMEALQSQIQPHFLYNTLDCIHWQAVVSGNQDISSMVKALASYYRICLSKGRDIITIGEELEYTRNYLYIQKMRYDEILNYEIITDPHLEGAMIPKLTLQPLVENSIYHGLKIREDNEGQIKITLTGDDQEIQLEVQDNGVGMTQEKIEEMNEMIKIYDEEFGYGVRNVNRRIQIYYGHEYGIRYSKNEMGGVTVRVRLPHWYKMKGQ